MDTIKRILQVILAPFVWIIVAILVIYIVLSLISIVLSAFSLFFLCIIFPIFTSYYLLKLIGYDMEKKTPVMHNLKTIYKNIKNRGK